MFDHKIRSLLERAFCKDLKESSLKDDGSFIKKPLRVGKLKDTGSILLFGKRDSYFPFQCFVGPDWPMLVFVYALILAANLTVLPIVTYLGWPVTLIGSIGFVLLLYFYSAVACSDPGIIFDNTPDSAVEMVTIVQGRVLPGDVEEQRTSQDSEEAANSPTTVLVGKPINAPSASESNTTNAVVPLKDGMECGQCELQRPYTARHCHHCGVCVDGLDHHCPWCGKCIGKRNMFFFKAFLSLLCFQCYFLMGTIIYYLVTVFATDLPKGPPI